MNVSNEVYQKTNRLANEKSPYLLQHAHNPVDWFPWGTEAFDRAKAEDKPVFLSIGYSTCHWCHVMERESFEDSEVSQILNTNYISIKVDREERPDIDHIYMSVCQALTGQGGWPLTIIMTPDCKPFFAGTYFPKHDHHNMMGLMSLLNRIPQIWKTNRNDLIESSNEILDAINRPIASSNEELNQDVFHKAFSQFKSTFDNKHGGFGRAPKFPSPHNLYFLLRHWYTTKDVTALNIVEKTLDSMYKGGIYDHIGFGFCRYSTDSTWLVPHFEKMLYDNALLTITYLETYQATRNPKYSNIAMEIMEYVLRDMTSPEGGFYSAEDADSEGKEGKFYVWTPEEIIEVLGKDDGEKFCKNYDITTKGNFEGKNIPNIINTSLNETDHEFYEECRVKLFRYREKRTHPYKDDKILTSWNGLMIAAFAIGGRILGKKEYIDAAEKANQLINSKLFRNDGRLLARYRDGEAAYPAYADDYAFLIWGLIELYETTFKPEYLKSALEINEDLLKYFWDNKNGGLYVYGSDSEKLIARPKEIYDGATPSANSVASLNLFRLSRLTGRFQLEDKAYQILKAFHESITSYPAGHTFSIIAYMYANSNAKEIIVVSETVNKDSQIMIQTINDIFNPFSVSLFYSEDRTSIKSFIPFLNDYIAIDGKTTAYVCEKHSCQAPITSNNELREMLTIYFAKNILHPY